MGRCTSAVSKFLLRNPNNQIICLTFLLTLSLIQGIVSANFGERKSAVFICTTRPRGLLLRRTSPQLGIVLRVRIALLGQFFREKIGSGLSRNMLGDQERF